MAEARRALVVDDEALVCQLVSDVLEMRGYEIATAGDGEAGVALFREADYDLVMTDIKMPRMDGLEALLHIRALSQHVAVIVMTGHGGDEERVRAERLGALFLRKPFRLTILNSLLDMIESGGATPAGGGAQQSEGSIAMGSQSDRRRHARVQANIPGKLLDATSPGRSPEACRVLDLGLGGGGVQVEVGSVLPVETTVVLSIPEAESVGDLTGQVAWTNGVDRCGIRFTDLPDEVRTQLENFVVEKLRQLLSGASGAEDDRVVA